MAEIPQTALFSGFPSSQADSMARRTRYLGFMTQIIQRIAGVDQPRSWATSKGEVAEACLTPVGAGRIVFDTRVFGLTHSR